MKIIKLINWIGVGICQKQFIQKHNKMNITQLGEACYYEGAYLISQNQYSWSPLIKDNNHNQINLQLFLFQMTNDLVPCANLCSVDDFGRNFIRMINKQK